MSPQTLSQTHTLPGLLVTPETLEAVFVYCSTCARETLAEAPPCPDGHGNRCPDRACLECGTALLDASIVDLVRAVPPTVHLRPRHAA